MVPSTFSATAFTGITISTRVEGVRFAGEMNEVWRRGGGALTVGRVSRRWRVLTAPPSRGSYGSQRRLHVEREPPCATLAIRFGGTQFTMGNLMKWPK